MIADQALDQAVAAVRSRIDIHPAIGVVTGSGFAGLADRLESPEVVPWFTIAPFATPTVPGHTGDLVVGRLGGRPVAVMQGRLHFYEGWSMEQVSFGVRLLNKLGVGTLVLTNASGALNPAFMVGDIMIVTDHINLPGLAGHSPLVELRPVGMERFVAMTSAYDPDLARSALNAGARLGIRVQQGIYAMVAGPSFETPAELRFLRAAGADAVGMSTVPEVVVARYLGMRVLALSCITNMALGEATGPQVAHAMPMHQQVLAAGREIAPRLTTLIEAVIQQLP